ncbi:folate transporter carrier-like isoform X2 [Octopus vulgaris]|uniref:Solute carrier family 25 member 32 n=1 Tax=Octopus vulgaris TaxID=6645 RepID=A0AA36ARJ8_OCTVU|nr:folate transporter carrier-like isoform X2 [Octopus vulgaris]
MSKVATAATAVAVMDASNVKSKVSVQNTSNNNRLLGLAAATGSSSTSSTSPSRPRPIVRWRDMEHLVAGISGGVLSTLVLHPLDLVKIRFQVNEGTGVTARPNYNSFIHAVRSIVCSQGFTGLYQGVSANCLGAGMAWGIYFFVYNYAKTQMQAGDQKVSLGASSHILAASQAGVLSLLVVNPVFVAKTRLCLQYEQTSEIHKKTYYRGLSDALVKIFKQEGFKGFYKGFIPGVFGVSHGVIQFVTYEEMKSLYNKYHERPIHYRLSSLEYITFAAISKMIAAAATYPYQVVRSRLQDQHASYVSCRDVIEKTWRHEGVYGFYKGLVPNLVRVTPACCITFLVYETMMSKFADRREQQEQLEAELEAALQLQEQNVIPPVNGKTE